MQFFPVIGNIQKRRYIQFAKQCFLYLRQYIVSIQNTVIIRIHELLRAAAGGMREVTSPTEAGRLVDALMNTSNPEQTPSGKRILTFQSIVDIDKLF